ncbi:MAG: hypothetical protein R3264_01770 [Anaerolineae bacterium]|nr:hypothetical protein [Anaerolineae bacterium]
MAESYPDIMGEFISQPERFQAGGVQFGGQFDPDTIAPGQASELYVFFQNTLDTPVTIQIKIEVPKKGGFFGGGKPMLKIGAPQLELKMDAAEASLLSLPVATTEHTKAGQEELTFELKVKPNGRGQRIRPAKFQSSLDPKLIDEPAGLNLVSSMGATFVEKAVKKATFPLTLEGDPQPVKAPATLKHSFRSMWTKEQLKTYSRATQEINKRQEKLKSAFTTGALYASLYSESVAKFADAGLPLRVGEAIALAKILTYCCQYFLSSPKRINGLLVPIWERAIDAEFDTTDGLRTLRIVGFNHILKLAIMMSFGLVAQAAGRQIWSIEERQGVTQHLANNIEIGETTEEDFLYLPLMMGGTLVSNKVKIEGENVRHSLALLEKAYEARPRLFLDSEMAEVEKLFAQLLQKAVKVVT